MNLSRIAIAIAVTASLIASVAPAGVRPPSPSSSKRLYHWVGADGRDHYSDDLPPEALDQARQELSNSGLTLKQVERAQTSEEKAAAVAKAAADAKSAAELEKARQSDQVLLSSYPTEDELKRAYSERLEQQMESIKTIRIELRSQQDSLTALLNAASNLELSDKPVKEDLAKKIRIVHMQVLGQQRAQVLQAAQVQKLKEDSAAEIARYRSLRAAAEARGATDGHAPEPTTETPAAPHKG